MLVPEVERTIENYGDINVALRIMLTARTTAEYKYSGHARPVMMHETGGKASNIRLNEHIGGRTEQFVDRHRFTSQLVVPSLLSLSTMPMSQQVRRGCGRLPPISWRHERWQRALISR